MRMKANATVATKLTRATNVAASRAEDLAGRRGSCLGCASETLAALDLGLSGGVVHLQEVRLDLLVGGGFHG
jgi:hypothetical protein